MTKTQELTDLIAHLNPCEDAVQWLSKQTTPTKAWANCGRGDWMLWLVGKLSGASESDGRKKLVLCACECARLALPIFEKKYPNDDRVRKCIETTERWARGEASIAEVRTAKTAAYDAASDAASDAAYAAYDAAIAAEAAASAASAAAIAAEAAASAASAAALAAASDAAYADRSTARAKTLKLCADIVRKHYPKPPKIK